MQNIKTLKTIDGQIHLKAISQSSSAENKYIFADFLKLKA